MPRRARLLLAVLLATTLLVGGCSSASSDDEASPTPSAAPGAGGTTAASTTGEQPPAAPRARPGRAGERAFARHVMALWGFALRTNDVRPLVSLGGAARTCGGCAALRTELARRRAQKWSVDFRGVDVRRLRVSGPPRAAVARATVDIPASDSFHDDGTFRNTSPAHAGASFDVRMRFTGRAYRLVSFTVS